eukprot:TRINITY_DN56645_c0_g1_i1.p1 TRINITY_DN56645_c0_g1~~TRINITY_DN56645_c0_g1_i1.p1  ORF type:complete len:459 (+),score=39.12 TRINITY_DN56645_c0_g1_i1:128-1504(+)
MTLPYSDVTWFQLVFTAIGTVWPDIRYRFFCLSAWVILSWFGMAFMKRTYGWESRPATDFDHLFGSCLSIHLVFRANQAYNRFKQGRLVLVRFFTNVRGFILLTTLYVYGGGGTQTPLRSELSQYEICPEDYLIKARQLRVDLVRLAIAFAVTIKILARLSLDGYHLGSIDRDTKWKIDWDRFRLRQLLTEDEFRVVDNCVGIMPCDSHVVGMDLQAFENQFHVGEDHVSLQSAPTDWPESFDVDSVPCARAHVPIVLFLRQLLVHNLNDFLDCTPWGVKERFIPSFWRTLRMAQSALEEMDMIISTPLPLPYACLCKTLLAIYMIDVPFKLDVEDGFLHGVSVPLAIALALLGIDAIAVELENPFGDDANDLDIDGALHSLECEALEMLRLCGDGEAANRFVWRMSPFAQASTSEVVKSQLAFGESACLEENSKSASPASSCRSSRMSGSGSGSRLE